MHVGRGDTAPKTEANYFPPPRTAYGAADTSRFYVDGTGFIDFCEKFNYLGYILYYSLTSDANVVKRIASATAAFGALKNIFNYKYLSEASSPAGGLCRRRLDGTLSVSYKSSPPSGSQKKKKGLHNLPSNCHLPSTFNPPTVTVHCFN